MVVDTSALVAFMLDEEDADHFESRLVHSPRTVMSVANVIEAAIVLSRKGRGAHLILDSTLDRMAIDAVDVTVEHMFLARHGFALFGKGSGHPAQLNFGDCFAYALARSLGAPLLFKGRDFEQTDVTPA